MSLANINYANIEPKSLHFTDGGVFDADPANDTLQVADWSAVIPYAGLTDNQVLIVPLGSNFNTGHAYHISLNIALNAVPSAGFGASPTTYFSSWESAIYMGGNLIYSTLSRWTSISPVSSMGTTDASFPSSFIIVVDTTRTLQLYFTANFENDDGVGSWAVNSNPAYVVTGKVSYIDLGQVSQINQGVQPIPPPQPIPPNFDPVAPLLLNQGGTLFSLPGLVTPYVYPTI
jgi:hypothetical protein